MSLLSALLLYLGIIPSIALVILCYYKLFRGHKPEHLLRSDVHGVKPKPIGGSSVRSAGQISHSHLASENRPLFKTLRVRTTAIDEAQWRFSIRFLLYNSTQAEIHLDDIHAKVYARYIPTAPRLTISYRGEMLLLQDNTIWKDNESYGLARNDGYEIDLILDLARREGAPVYGPVLKSPGPIIAAFGLVVDYYSVTDGSVERHVVPSDSLYFFECASAQASQESSLRFVDDDFLRELESRLYWTEEAKKIAMNLPLWVAEHRAYRATPTA